MSTTIDPGPNHRIVDTAKEPWRSDAEYKACGRWHKSVGPTYIKTGIYRVPIDPPSELDNMISELALREQLSAVTAERDELREKLAAVTSMREERSVSVVNEMIDSGSIEFFDEAGLWGEVPYRVRIARKRSTITITGPSDKMAAVREFVKEQGCEVTG